MKKRKTPGRVGAHQPLDVVGSRQRDCALHIDDRAEAAWNGQTASGIEGAIVSP